MKEQRQTDEDRKEEKLSEKSFDRGGSVPIIRCFHVGSIMSAAGLPHFLLLSVNTPACSPGEQTGRASSSEVSRPQKHSH